MRASQVEKVIAFIIFSALGSFISEHHVCDLPSCTSLYIITFSSYPSDEAIIFLEVGGGGGGKLHLSPQANS